MTNQVRCQVVVLLAAAALLFAGSSTAEACSCAGVTTFDELIKKMPVVVVGSVSSVGFEQPNTGYSGADPSSMVLQVQWVAKGQLTQDRITAWNDMAGSSCGGAFKDTPAGTEIAVALVPVAAVRPLAAEFWSLTKFNPPDSDFLVTTACSVGFVILQTEADRAKFVGQRLP